MSVELTRMYKFKHANLILSSHTLRGMLGVLYCFAPACNICRRPQAHATQSFLFAYFVYFFQ